MDKPTADQAFVQFCKLGNNRSIPKLHTFYMENVRWTAPSAYTLGHWSRRDAWRERAAEWDVETTNRAALRAGQIEAEERAEVSLIVEDAYREMLDKVRQLLPKVTNSKVIPELVTAAGLLHGQLMEIQRGKLPDQGLLEKLVQQMAVAGGNGAPPDDDELQKLLDLAMAPPGKPLN